MRPMMQAAAVLGGMLLLGLAHAQARPATTLASASAVAPAVQVAQADTKPDTSQKEEAGKLTAQGWLVLLDRRDWGTAWEAAGNTFRQNVPLDRWMDAIPKVREPFGPLQDRKVLQTGYKTQLPGQPAGDYVTVIFASKFQNKADAQETVTTVLDSDGRWRVTGYSAR